MNIDKVHCLFEQSGTFKNEFIKLGIQAEDYDILNQFNQTDHVIDLYNEIEACYKRERRSSTLSRKKTSYSLSSLASDSRIRSFSHSVGSNGKTRNSRTRKN